MPGWTGLKRLLIATALLAIIAPSFGCAPLFGPHSAVPRPEALDQEPYRRVKRHFRTWDITDPAAVERLSEASNAIAAFTIALHSPPWQIREPLESLIAPGAEAQLRRPRPAGTKPVTSYGLHVGYGFTAWGENRLAFLAKAVFFGDPGADYTDGFVFERLPSGRWVFVCHLSGFPKPPTPSDQRLQDGWPAPALLPPGTAPLC